MYNYIEFLSMKKYIENNYLIEEYKTSFKNTSVYLQKFIKSFISIILINAFVLMDSLLSERNTTFFKWYLEDSSGVLKVLMFVAMISLITNLAKYLRSLLVFRYLKKNEVISKLHLLVVDSIKINKNYENILNNSYYNSYWGLFSELIIELEGIPKGNTLVLMDTTSTYSTLKSRLLSLDLNSPQNNLANTEEITLKQLFI